MKRVGFVGLSLALMISSASAARVEFVGTLDILSVTTACTTQQETEINRIYEMRYNPPNLGVADDRTSLSLHEGTAGGGAQNYTLPTGSLIGTAFQTVAGTGIYRHAFTYTTTMRIISQAPAALTTATNSVTLVGNINNFDGVTGCNVQFRAVGVQH
jgi:hypothetical protein